jgi:hypothetical protein
MSYTLNITLSPNHQHARNSIESYLEDLCSEDCNFGNRSWEIFNGEFTMSECMDQEEGYCISWFRNILNLCESRE